MQTTEMNVSKIKNLLLINFEVDPNSQVLSWQYRLVCEMAKNCDHVVVLTEKYVPSPLPVNVEVHAVPMCFIRAPLRLLGAKWLMNIPVLLWMFKYRFDACFIHMNMGWAYRLAACFKLFKTPVLLWYAHGTVTRSLRMAHFCADRVITSTPEGFRIPSDKVRVIGQGIDTDLFKPQVLSGPVHDILSVGRISRRKRTDLLIEAMDCLKRDHPDTPIRLVLIGAPINGDDKNFLKGLEQMVQEKGLQRYVHFAGHVPQEKIPDYYRTAFLHINVSKTGSMDKTVMESLAAGCSVLTSNEAFYKLLSDFPNLILKNEHPSYIAKRIIEFHNCRKDLPRYDLRELLIEKHDLKSYLSKILLNIKELMATNSRNLV